MARLNERLDRIEAALTAAGIELPPLRHAVEEPDPAAADQTAADESEDAAPAQDTDPAQETATATEADERETR